MCTSLVPRRELGNKVVYLVKVLVVECCTQRSLMTDYVTMRMMLLVIMTWLQCTQLGGRGREEGKGGGVKGEGGEEEEKRREKKRMMS